MGLRSNTIDNLCFLLLVMPVAPLCPRLMLVAALYVDMPSRYSKTGVYSTQIVGLVQDRGQVLRFDYDEIRSSNIMD